MKIIGLSGGIASGKNTVADIFHELGIEVFDADAVVHNLYLHDQKIIELVAQNFPETFDQKIINRRTASACTSICLGAHTASHRIHWQHTRSRK